MDNNKLLFTNKFISDMSSINDIPSNKKEIFRNYYNDKLNTQNKQEIINKINRPIKNEIYNELSTFYPGKNIDKQNIESQIEQTEKKSIINIDTKKRNTNMYPKQNDFTTVLNKTYYNIKRIELKSTEFPNTDQVIKDLPIELQNNIISWQNEEDNDLNFYNNVLINTIISDTIDITISNHLLTIGSEINITIYNSKLDTDTIVTAIIDGKKRATVIDDNTLRIEYIGGISQGTASIDLGYPEYTVTIKPGNYSVTTLTEQIQTDMGKIKRRNGNGNYHYFEVSVNLDTDIISLDSVSTTQLPNNSISTIAGTTIITVYQLEHGFKTGDRVKMIGVKSIAGISSTNLNGDFNITVIDFNTFTYEVTIRANETVAGGGNTILVGKDAPFRILFDTENTLIQYNIGYPNEDSSEYINIDNPITTKALNISNVVYNLPNNIMRFTTTINHQLDTCNIININSITISNIITCITPHLIELPSRVYIRNTNTVPVIKGDYYVIPIGKFSLRIQGPVITTGGNSGQILYGGDKVDIIGLNTVPSIENEISFFVENTSLPNQFDITFNISSIDIESYSTCIVKTSQVFINHPNHNFNILSTITNLGLTFANCKTFLPHTLVGSRIDNVSIIDGPPNTNTVDILLIKHSLFTSDTIIIKNATTLSSVNGQYTVQVVDTDTLRINFVHSTFTNGFGTIILGDNIIITGSNSIPRIDGEYSIHNKEYITNISTGTVFSTITTSTDHNWSVGDIISISDTNSTPELNGEYTIQSIVNNVSFTILLSEDITNIGTSGFVINTVRFEIETGFTVDSPGVYPAGNIGRDLSVIHYRIEAGKEGTFDIGGISLDILNGVKRNISKIIDTNNYMIRTDENFAYYSTTAGGSNVTVSSNIHGLRSIQSNTDTGTKTGKLYRSITLEGVNYVYLSCSGPGYYLDTVSNDSNINDAFAKIILSESPGTMMFNTFVTAPKDFELPLSKLEKMRFRIYTPDGYLFNFNDINYSFSLEITEIVSKIKSTELSSRNGDYNGNYIDNNISNNKKLSPGKSTFSFM